MLWHLTKKKAGPLITTWSQPSFFDFELGFRKCLLSKYNYLKAKEGG